MDLLIVEDDSVLGKALLRGLTESGHRCELCANGRKALALALAQKFDAIVLDLMLPELPGMEILRSLRGAGIQTPVLVLTASGSVADRVTGLEGGADDYLVKPFEFPELVARLNSICRRSFHLASTLLKVGELTLDLSLRRVTRNSREIDLTPTEFQLIEFLMRNAGQVITRKMLCEHLWDQNWEGVTNVIEVHINRLRNKVDRGFGQPLIHTIRGRGYVLRAS